MSFDLFVYVESFDATMQQAWLRALERRGVRCALPPGFLLDQQREGDLLACTVTPPLVREAWPTESVGVFAHAAPADPDAFDGLIDAADDPAVVARAAAATVEFHFASSSGRSNTALLLQCHGAAALAEVANGVLVDPQAGLAVIGPSADAVARRNSDWALPSQRPAAAAQAVAGTQMPRHVKTARAHGALSWLYGALGLLFCLLPYFVLTATRPATAKDLLMASATPLLFFALCGLHRVVANAAGVRKPWARTATLLIGVLALFAFPVGTLIGIYLLANSSWDPAEARPAGPA